MLKRNGWTQTRIADELNLSQPLVSQYLRKKAHSVQINKRMDLAVREVADEITGLFLTGKANRTVLAVETICRQCKLLRTNGVGCSIHMSVSPIFQTLSGCSSCHLTNSGIELLTSERREIIQRLETAFSQLQKLYSIKRLVPQIGLQVVYGTTSISSILDIAGFPGRVSVYKGNLIKVSNPEFGASEHTARLLVLLHNLHPKYRAVIGLSFIPDLLKNIHKIDIEFDVTNTIPGGLDPDGGLLALVNRPSVGIEGIIYLCADSPETLVDYLSGLVS